MALFSITDLELYLGKTITDTTDEAVYTYLITSIQSSADIICFRTLEETTYTSELYDGTGGNELSLNNYPVTAVSEVKYGWVWGGSTRNEIESDDYMVYNDIGTLAFGFNSMDDDNLVFEITYTAGYTSINVPTDLKTILMNETETQFKNTTSISGFSGLKKEKIGDFSYEKFTPSEQEVSAFTMALTKYIKIDI